jgi:sigma-B regulation protein RsbU (phosphoserine phosphatase)
LRPNSASPAHWNAAILIVDDDPANRELLARRLERYGARGSLAQTGLEALQMLRKTPFDLVLLDLLMPGLDGCQVLAKLKADRKLRYIPVIMISGLDQENGIARCLEMGAEDYLTKPFNPLFLRARIGACLEKKHWRDQEQKTWKALVESQEKIAASLSEAARYVESLLPRKMSSPVVFDYFFRPSAQLGGDIFDCHRIDDGHLAIYLLDVSGHGVGAALLSVSLMNLIRAGALRGVDFREPAAVLRALNETFPMENQNNFFFTIWYGVYSVAEQRLVYANGGHPPALLRGADGVRELGAKGAAIGCLPECEFGQEETTVGAGNQLLLFSDGVYELAIPEGKSRNYRDFAREIQSLPPGPISAETIFDRARQAQGRADFDDDFSLLTVLF